MTRWLLEWPKLAAIAALTIFVGIQGCSASIDIVGVSPGFDVTLGTTAASVAPGGTATTFIKVVRTGGLSGGLTYTFSGAPAGLTARVDGTPAPDSSTLTVSAAATVAPAAYPIVVTAIAPGVTPRQATITVTVTAPVGGGVPEIQTVAIGAHTCALSTAGIAYCWGYNGGVPPGSDDTPIVTPTAVVVSGGLTFQALSVSKVTDLTCGLSSAGAAYCWGQNFQGQLGDGTTTPRLVPTPVAGGLAYKSIAVGNGHVCAVTTDGVAYCWGTSPNGAMGDGSPGPRLTPTLAVPGLAFQSVVAGSDFTCGLTPGGVAYCWGLGVFGQLGDGTANSTTTPVAVSGGLVFRSLAAAGLAVCGLTTDGKAYCWGHNFYGTLGDGTSAVDGGTSRRLSPVAVAGGLTFESLSAGFETMCGVIASGAGYCWGYNESGGVGDGSTTHRSTPVAVAGGLTFRSVSAGTGASCGVTTANAVYCWGENSNGGLGDGTIVSRPTPAPVRWQ
jgi:alpha-tubulin suppressor-like RCC1 family protein